MTMDRIAEAIAKYAGAFLEPIDGVPVRCPIHGNIGRSSPFGELYCAMCRQWLPAVPDLSSIGSRLKRRPVALRAQIARQRKPRRRRSRKDRPGLIDAEAIRRRIEGRQKARQEAPDADDG